MTKEDLLQSFEEGVEAKIPLKLALDEGELVFTKTQIYFISIRLGQWDVVEKWERNAVSRWKLHESFMGQELAIFTPDGRFLFRKIPADIDWETLFNSAHQFAKNESAQKKREPEYQATRGEAESAGAFSYQESAEELMDMFSKHVAQTEAGQPQDLKDLFKQKKKTERPKQAKKDLEKELKKELDDSFEALPEQKKKNGCSGCFKLIFWFFFLSLLFSSFLTSFLKSL